MDSNFTQYILVAATFLVFLSLSVVAVVDGEVRGMTPSSRMISSDESPIYYLVILGFDLWMVKNTFVWLIKGK